jgi:hypothetical protein
MLKKSASNKRPLFGLFGLSGFLVDETYRMNQIDQYQRGLATTGGPGGVVHSSVGQKRCTGWKKMATRRSRGAPRKS